MWIGQGTHDYFEVGDRDDLSYGEKLERYREFSDAYFQTAEFEDFRATALARLDEVGVEYFESKEFDDLAVRSIRLEVEPEAQDEMIERCRELVAQAVA